MTNNLKKKIGVVGLLFAVVAIGWYTWGETQEIRLCLELSRKFGVPGRIPNTIDELPPSIKLLQWIVPNKTENHGQRDVAEGTRAYTLTCHPDTLKCSLLWYEAGKTTGRSQCIHPGSRELTDLF